MKLKSLAAGLFTWIALVLLPQPAYTVTYGVLPLTYNPPLALPSTEGTHLLSDSLDSSINIPVGFTFRFYGENYTTLFVTAKAYLAFRPGPVVYTPFILPTPSLPASIFGFWRDLDPSAGGSIYYTTIGSAPDRALVVSYNHIPYFSGKGDVTMQIVLYETSNDIEFYIKEWTGATVATQGIQNQAGNLAAALPGRNDRLLPPSNNPEGWLFTTLPSPPLNLKGVQKWNRFATQAELVNIITWEAPLETEQPVTSYYIYSDAKLTNLIGYVPADEPLIFEDHNVSKNRTYAYYITARGANSLNSAASRVVVRRVGDND
jgi:hypothetical protein